ncbi:unnamed protein product [Pseudo-nitzschia multistriata]|uniref:Uncharacterized protein n=1 Tax=Pseudo-nitzschia multistriata TaxID=183589 RepID=A0A448ZAP1_9STRA|nr:unnamed protein product [Pseudo-nitzschia multistriata]
MERPASTREPIIAALEQTNRRNEIAAHVRLRSFRCSYSPHTDSLVGRPTKTREDCCGPIRAETIPGSAQRNGDTTRSPSKAKQSKTKESKTKHPKKGPPPMQIQPQTSPGYRRRRHGRPGFFAGRGGTPRSFSFSVLVFALGVVSVVALLALLRHHHGASRQGAPPRSSFRKAAEKGRIKGRRGPSLVSPPLPPLSSSFDWSDVRASQKVEGNCGADKCFWRSVSDPENVGYLVASAGYHYERMARAYDFATATLEKACHARHLYLSEPLKVGATKEFLRELNGLRKNPYFAYVDEVAPKGTKPKSDRLVFDENDPHLVVQKVKVAPPSSLAFGYLARKWDLLVTRDLPAFRTHLVSLGIDPRSLEAKLDEERRKIECAMDHSPTYWYDLQGLIDEGGNYHHTDVDSQFWVEVGDPSDEDLDLNDRDENEEGVRIVDAKETYGMRHELIARFNEMIQRLVDPPPEGVDELPAWDDDSESESNSESDLGNDHDSGEA